MTQPLKVKPRHGFGDCHNLGKRPRVLPQVPVEDTALGFFQKEASTPEPTEAPGASPLLGQGPLWAGRLTSNPGKQRLQGSKVTRRGPRVVAPLAWATFMLSASVYEGSRQGKLGASSSSIHFTPARKGWWIQNQGLPVSELPSRTRLKVPARMNAAESEVNTERPLISEVAVWAPQGAQGCQAQVVEPHGTCRGPKHWFGLLGHNLQPCTWGLPLSGAEKDTGNRKQTV